MTPDEVRALLDRVEKAEGIRSVNDILAVCRLLREYLAREERT